MESAVVTGGARGLGRAIAGRLAERGLAVLVTDIDGALAEQAAHEIGRGATASQLDVRDASALRSAAAEATKRGRLAVWVNNAGVVRAEPVTEHADEDVDLLVATNLLGVVNGSRAAIERMRVDGGGRILNVASLSALTPAPGLAVYGATKHGVLAFSVALQAELRHARVPVEVRSICPDAIRTDMVLRDQATERATALSWSGIRLLEVDEAADRAVEVLYGDRLVASLPVWRGALSRFLGLAPRFLVRAAPLFERVGEWNRRRWKRG
jgi:NAD(P)-dependent dehydrogenase (short-subunit alcohol dehydrogenase family)